MQLFGILFSILCFLVVWGTFLASAILSGALLLKWREERKLSVAQMRAVLVCTIYMIGILLLKIFVPSVFNTLIPAMVAMLCAISTAYSNYEDKKNGKRWWNW